MPAYLALLASLLFLAVLLRVDPGRSASVSRAVWLPIFWVFFIGSRFPAQWLQLEIPEGYDVSMEGSPMDRAVLLGLIALGLIVLYRRRVNWGQIISQNRWLFLFFLFGGISIIWSDYSVISLKRWIKVLGNLVMVLVIFTEKEPVETLKTVIRRCSYVLIPLSIVFIKYFPHLGRSYSRFTGVVSYHGVATNKNALGIVCMVMGVFFVWCLTRDKSEVSGEPHNWERPLHYSLLLMTLWLMVKASSATALVCLLLGSGIVVGLKASVIRRNTRNMGFFIVASIVVVFVFNAVFDLGQMIISGLGRDITLTGRTELWTKLLGMKTNPLLGTGFESFWLGWRVEYIQADYWWRPNQAHNGYLETYLNMGLLGLFFLFGAIVAGYRHVSRSLMSSFDFSRLKMAFLITALVYNMTEATFKGINLIYFIFLIAAVEITVAEMTVEEKPIVGDGSQKPESEDKRDKNCLNHLGVV